MAGVVYSIRIILLKALATGALVWVLSTIIQFYCSVTHHNSGRALKVNSRELRPAYRPDLPQGNIVFAKVHKAASSTVQNILYRYAFGRGKNIILSKNGIHLNHEGHRLPRESVIPIPESETYNILASHLIFNETEIVKFFPESTLTKYVAILREPLDRSLSAIVYYTVLWTRKPVSDAVVRHLPDPLGFYVKHPYNFTKDMSEFSFFGNGMARDLGFPVAKVLEARRNHRLIKEFIDYIDDRFDLVMITEMFDESLVLLRRLLNLEMRDILYMPINSFQSGNRYVPSWTKNRNFTDEEKQKYLKDFSVFDYWLYSHFFLKLKKKIKEEPFLREEIVEFRIIKILVENFCKKALASISAKNIPLFNSRHFLSKNQSSKPQDKAAELFLEIHSNEWTKGFNVTLQDCLFMTTSEIQIGEYAKKRQRLKLNRKI